MSTTETLVMNRDALDEIITDCDRYLASCTRDSEEWQLGFSACMQWVQMFAAPVVEACEADYGDAGGPVMTQEALTYLTHCCDRNYDDNRNTGNGSATWLLGVAAGIQRLEMYGGDIVADCT